MPINDHIAVSNALLRLLNDEQKAQEMGMKGRKRIEAEFDVQNVVPKFEALYQAVLKSKKSS
ncbi:MAG: hypothetical protein EOM12_16115 [Verrucomicrobiae bacterium]|nr:hypothetical protein [Verrucomicrobiae bacterium]